MNEIKAHEIILEMLPDCGQEKLYKQNVLCKFENHDVLLMQDFRFENCMIILFAF